ncbi:MAG: alpha/beta hydrolase [Tahibacter sp.]
MVDRLFQRAGWVAVLGCCVALPAHATRVFTGPVASGATFHIEVPDGWHSGDPLVLYQHGLSFDPVGSDPGAGPLRDAMLADGYAIAASSYRQRGWAMFTAMDDNRDVLAIFRRDVGEPGELLPFGGSLGGLVALELAEQYDFRDRIKGVLAVCPPAAGARAWDAAFDVRLGYDSICAGVGGGELPRGDAPLNWAYNLDDIPASFSNVLDTGEVLRALVRVTQCTGLALPASLRTNGMRDRLARLKTFSGISDEDFLALNLGYSTFVMSDLVRAPDKLASRNPFDNLAVDYGADVNAGIQRVSADPLAALDFRAVSDLRGNVGSAKVLSLHTSGDALVIPANQSVLRQRIPAAQLLSGIVHEDEPSHCGFTDAEGDAAWKTLKDWKGGGPKPDMSTLQQTCIASGASGSDCRFDADAVVPVFDSKVRPRTNTPAPIDARYSGDWFDPSRNGEGVAIEMLSDRQALVYFFTYPPAGSIHTQAWVNGVGEVYGNGIVVAPAYSYSGDASSDGSAQPWGRMSLAFDDCTHGHLRWEGPANFGTREVPLVRLTGLSGLGCNNAATATVPSQASGSWFDPSHAGDGFHIEQLDATHVLAQYYRGNRAGTWLTGVGVGNVAQGVDVDMYRSGGAHFGAAFDPAEVTQTPVGRIHLSLNCDRGSASMDATAAAAIGATQLDLVRITRPAGVLPCPS